MSADTFVAAIFVVIFLVCIGLYTICAWIWQGWKS